MASTLSEYVDLDNVPKKYGGNLDWKFGDMPSLDPGIVNSMKWKENFEQKGHKTLPIGPLKMQYDEDGDLLIVAVGTEGGKQRNQVIAGLHPDSSIAQLSLSPGRADHQKRFNNTPTQVSTPESKPSTPAVPETKSSTPAVPESKPSTLAEPESKMASEADQNVGKDPHSHVSSSSVRGTYTVPYQDDNTRAGTSSTRYNQQEGTHAEGELADGTPHVKSDNSAGDRPAVMDPNTVGQAPKEHRRPETEEAQPSMMDQAKDMAGQAVEQAKELPNTVMNAVGMGSKKEEEPQEQETKPEDPKIDSMAGKNVEEFLRSKTMSKPEA